MTDSIGSAHMTQGQGVQTTFVPDRFGQSNAALSLNGGWTQVPSGVYFDTPQFSISLWIYPISFTFCSRILDFGNGQFINNVILVFDGCTGSSLLTGFSIFDTPSNTFSTGTYSIPLMTQQWQYLVATFDGVYMKLYLNQILLISTLHPFALTTVVRAFNYIGKDNWDGTSQAWMYLDDLKFYSIALTQSQISDLFIQSGSYSLGSPNLDFYLTHYWPISNSHMTDAIGTAHLSQGSATTFVSDRFGNANAALSLNGGWTYAPSGIYFSSKFTISAWVYPQLVCSWARVIEFNDLNSNLIILTLDKGDLNSFPCFSVYIQGSIAGQPCSFVQLQPNQWQFLVASYDGSNMMLYINGVITASLSTVFSVASVVEVQNYIGKSSASGDGYSSSYLDDLRFYSIALSQIQINDLMMSNRTSSASSNPDDYLTHYWPISNGSMVDVVSYAHMQQGASLLAFASDRFGNPNSALNLNQSWAYVPAGYYFDAPQFTITAWIYPSQLGSGPRLIDFGNGLCLDIIDISLMQATYLEIFTSSCVLNTLFSTNNLILDQWQFLTTTYDGTTMSFFLNGINSGSRTLIYTLPTIIRTQNYIGQANWPNFGYSSSLIDDLKFYSIALSASQIVEKFLQSGSYQTGTLNMDSFLTNYWPIANAQMIDLLCGADMQQGSRSVLFASDRFGNANAALSLNGGFTQVILSLSS